MRKISVTASARFVSKVKRRFRKRNHIFISSTPKSAGTFICNIISLLTDYKIAIPIKAFDRSEQDIDYLRLVDSIDSNTISYQHMRSTEYNLSILDEFAIRPVILVRNIFEIIPSLKKHMDDEPENTWWPMGYISEDYYKLPLENQINFIIDAFAPWIIQFYVSWYHSKKKEWLWLDFEDVTNSLESSLQKIFDYSGVKLAYSSDEVEFAASKVKKISRISVNKFLYEYKGYQIDNVRKYAKYYPSVDFKRLGL